MMKNYLLFSLGLFVLTMSACSDEIDNVAEKRIVIERWLELWSSGDLSIADQIFTGDFTAYVPQFPVYNTESYKEEVTKTATTIQDLHGFIEDIIVEDHKVAGRFTLTGTAHGEFAGVQVDSTGYTNTWIIIFHFVDGRISKEWWEFDILGVMQQVGIVPPTAEGPPAMQRTTPENFVWGASSDITGDPGDPESNKALVMREFETWNERDGDKLTNVLDDIYAADFVHHDPARPHVTDLAGYKRWAVEECLIPFPDLTLTVEDIFAEGDKVVVRWYFMGTFIMTGGQITQTGNTIYRIADGKIVEAWCAFDMLGTVKQMSAAAGG
jgi:predicted ester cyclase